MDSEAMKDGVLAAVNALIAEFQAGPYAFLYESDLQCALFGALRERIPATIKIPRKWGNDRTEYEVAAVLSEYGVYGSGAKIDLVCIDPERAPYVEQETYGSQNVYLYCLPILVAIELKYTVMGSKCFLPVACEADRGKLADLMKADDEKRRPKHGLVLGFIQDTADDRSGSFKEVQESWRVKSVDNLDGVYFVAKEGLFKAPRVSPQSLLRK